MQPTVYLTFDDGPQAEVTPFVLEQLDRFDAAATFFCIGNNVAGNKELFDRIVQSRHAIGNHTYHHLNGWKVRDEEYLDDVARAAVHISSHLFRPPYGCIRRSQTKALVGGASKYSVVMWSVLAWDFDGSIMPAKCLKNVVDHARPRDIIVFHDSLKAAPRLEYALPRVLEHFRKKGWTMAALDSIEGGE